jgi:NAD+ kinase
VSFERVAIVAHNRSPGAADLRDEISKLLADRGVTVSDQGPDLVLSLGGDGTMLRAAQHAHAADAPLLGINLGTVGYLTEVEPGHEREAIGLLLEGSFTLEERMILKAEQVEANCDPYIVLNEVLVERASRLRLVKLSVSVGGERLATFNGDGVIVATPTGSTAYALSAGGPIVSPRAKCLVVVPVNPHMMFARPFVLGPDESVEVLVDGNGEGEGAVMSLDGATGCELAGGDRVLIQRHPRPLRLIRFEGGRFVERLRTKLHLPG